MPTEVLNGVRRGGEQEQDRRHSRMPGRELSRRGESLQALRDWPKTTNAESVYSRRLALTRRSAEIPRTEKAPRVILTENRSLIDRGVWQIRRLGRNQIVELIPWTTQIPVASTPSPAPSVNRDPMALALLYQSLLDSGLANTRAQVAKYFGVSRARVTQVLRRLENDSSGHRGGNPTGGNE